MRRGLSNIPNMISVAQMSAVTLLMGLYTLPSASSASGSSSSFPNAGSSFGAGTGSTSTGFRGMGLGAAGGNKADPMMAKQMERDGYMADILKCIKCLELSESRWIMARRFL